MPQVFISYASEDVATARQVADALRAAGIGVWIAPESILPGQAYNEAIVAGLRGSDALAILVSAASNASKHVVREVGLADQQSKRIVPIRIEPVEPSDGLTYYLSLPQWVEWHAHGAAALGPMIRVLGGAAAPVVVRSPPPPPAVVHEPPPPVRREAVAGAVIRIHRMQALTGSARNVAILIDGEKAGEVGNGSSIDLQVSPGLRKVQARVDYIKSAPFEVEAVSGRARVVELSMPDLSDLGGQMAGLLGQSKYFQWKLVE